TGTYNKAYYVKGVKKVSTGLYASKYYKDGKLATGTYKGAYYVKGLKKVTTGTYNGAYYVAGKKVVSTGLYKDQLYVSGKLNKGYKLYKEDLYKDAVLNKGLVVFEDKLYDGAKQNDKLVIFDGKLYDGVKVNEGIKKFEDKWYNNAELADGTFTIDGKEVAFENGVEVGAKVKSVEAINGTQIKVTFNKSIDASTVIGASDALQNITVAKVGSAAEANLKATLSDDKKSVTITSTSTTALNGEYNVAVKDAVKTTAGDKVEASTKIIKIEDKVAPTYVGFTKENASTFVFNFSEPINDLGSVVVKKADGTVLTTPNARVSKDGSTIKLELGANVEAGKDITVSFAGQTDVATNVLETPFSVTIQKGAKDGVAPEVTSVTPVNAKKFEIKFSEEVQGFTKDGLTVAGSTVKSVTQDKTDKTKYIAELNTAVSGLTNISVTEKSYADLSGEEGKAFSQIVNFAVDTVKPTATVALSVNKDGNQVLTFTTSEDTTLAKTTGIITLPAKAVKNYVTTSGDITLDAADLKAVEGSSTQYTVELSKVKFKGSALVKDTTYTVDLVAEVFADVAGNRNEAKKDAFTFTRGADKDATKPSVVSVSDDNLDTFTVDFGKTVELDNSTVVNKGNYYVAGATIDSVTLDANNVATVKLVSGSNNYTGKRTVKVTGIKATNGNVIDDYTATKNFKENVKPTVQSAKVSEVVKGKAETTTTTPATAVASDNTAVVTGTYTGTTDEVATYTYSTTTSKWTADKTLAGLSVTEPVGTTDGQSFTVTAKAAKTTTTPATAGKTTITVTLSEEVNALAGDYVLNVDGKKVDVKATVTATAKASNVVTIVIEKELTADDFAKGVTLTADDYKLTDGAGNKADIPAAGIKVSL
ncbi:Ig-like domain-containing protein, partial [Kurthia gibsonii]|uniref:Ig-like domain-containing protein n=1 Tax=Kurthia gibsonii TaxID=33946 RepID=UPI003983AA6D